MKKFSKIYETKEKILEVIGIDERDIKDICQDLIDEYDFNMKITPQWISKSGSIYYKANQAAESYPSLLVSLERELTDKQTGEAKTKKDPRNWNGGVYYENDANLIKLVYETITRLESMLDQGEIKVFYSIRSMNDIELRITTPIEETKLPIDVENVVDFIQDEIEYLEDLPYEEYKIEKTWSHGNERTIEIVPKNERGFHVDVSKFSEEVPGDVILARALKMGDRDNTYDLAIIANHIIKKVLSACGKEEAKRSDVVAKYYDEEPGIGNNDIVYITWNNQKLIKFTANTETIAKGNIITTKGIFKNESVQMVIDKLELKIEILVEKGYGDPD